jgi:hypothetical protein
MTDYDADGKLDVIVMDNTTHNLIVDHGVGSGWLSSDPATVAHGW